MCKSDFSVSKATALGTSTFVFWGTIFLLRFGLFVTPERAFLEAQHEVALQSRGRPLAEHSGTQFRSGARGTWVVAAEKGRLGGPGARPVTLPRGAGDGGGLPPQRPGAASTRRPARRGSACRSPARPSCNAEQRVGLLGASRLTPLEILW